MPVGLILQAFFLNQIIMFILGIVGIIVVICSASATGYIIYQSFKHNL